MKDIESYFMHLLSLSLPSAALLVILVPMIFLALDGAIGSVPAAPVDRLGLAVEALKRREMLHIFRIYALNVSHYTQCYSKKGQLAKVTEVIWKL